MRPGALRDEFGRFEDDRVAVGQGRSDLPCRNGNREVPRRDDAHDANCFAGDLDADARPHAWNQFARQPQRLAGEEIEDLGGPHGLANALDQRLAFLARQIAAQLVLASHDLVRCLLQHRMTCQRRRA